MALDGLLRLRSAVVSGILNGIDDHVWDPATDSHLAATYSAARLGRRRLNKQALRERFGIAPGDGTLLLGVISRLSEQKGLDLLLAALPHLRSIGANLVVIGPATCARAGFRPPQKHPTGVRFIGSMRRLRTRAGGA